MADITTVQSSHHKAGTAKRRQLSTRIDLTPMVDLGFLLITFFLFTTTLARPKVMSISMPYDAHDPIDATAWKDGQAMTILLSGNHQLYYYNGIGDDPMHPPIVQLAGFKEIRNVIINKKKQVRFLQEQHVLNLGNDAAFLIKPDVNSTYDDFVQIMDEMNINDVKMKAVVNITATDKALIATVH